MSSTLFLTVLEAGKYKIKAESEAHILILNQLLIVFTHGERNQWALSNLSYKSTNPFHEALVLLFNVLPKGPLAIPSHWRLSSKYMNWWLGIWYIQSSAAIKNEFELYYLNILKILTILTKIFLYIIFILHIQWKAFPWKFKTHTIMYHQLCKITGIYKNIDF